MVLIDTFDAFLGMPHILGLILSNLSGRDQHRLGVASPVVRSYLEDNGFGSMPKNIKIRRRPGLSDLGYFPYDETYVALVYTANEKIARFKAALEIGQSSFNDFKWSWGPDRHIVLCFAKDLIEAQQLQQFLTKEGVKSHLSHGFPSAATRKRYLDFNCEGLFFLIVYRTGGEFGSDIDEVVVLHPGKDLREIRCQLSIGARLHNQLLSLSYVESERAINLRRYFYSKAIDPRKPRNEQPTCCARGK